MYHNKKDESVFRALSWCRRWLAINFVLIFYTHFMRSETDEAVTGQLAEKPVRGQSSRRLVNSRTVDNSRAWRFADCGHLGKMFDGKFCVHNGFKCDFCKICCGLFTVVCSLRELVNTSQQLGWQTTSCMIWRYLADCPVSLDVPSIYCERKLYKRQLRIQTDWKGGGRHVLANLSFIANAQWWV